MHPATRELLNWYAQHARDLPWRGARDPYAIWISEVMLQQTRVEAVIPYYARWMARFPDVKALAQAEMDEVLQLWEGLGYYRRAHNLLRAARELRSEWAGRLPSDPEHLKRLPGIGRYTAAAIAAIAFDQDALALDGNLRRVLSRLIDLELDPRSREGEAALIEAGEALLPSGRASEFNQALMDLGAAICLPKRPACDLCPVKRHCLAQARGVQDQRPVRPAKRSIPHHTVAAGVLRSDGRVFIARRPAKGLLGGLWEFPGGKLEAQETLQQALQRELQEELGLAQVQIGDQIGVFQHAYTHFRVTLHAFECRLLQGEPDPLQHEAAEWVLPPDLGQYPMGKLDRLIAARLQ